MAIIGMHVALGIRSSFLEYKVMGMSLRLFLCVIEKFGKASCVSLDFLCLSFQPVEIL